MGRETVLFYYFVTYQCFTIITLAARLYAKFYTNLLTVAFLILGGENSPRLMKENSTIGLELRPMWPYPSAKDGPSMTCSAQITLIMRCTYCICVGNGRTATYMIRVWTQVYSSNRRLRWDHGTISSGDEKRLHFALVMARS